MSKQAIAAEATSEVSGLKLELQRLILKALDVKTAVDALVCERERREGVTCVWAREVRGPSVELCPVCKAKEATNGW